jgi:hypothetical protein
MDLGFLRCPARIRRGLVYFPIEKEPEDKGYLAYTVVLNRQSAIVTSLRAALGYDRGVEPQDLAKQVGRVT